MKFRDTVHIQDDSGSATYCREDHDTVDDCIRDYYDDRFDTVLEVEEYLERVGGYGFIEVDGDRVIHVKS